MVGETRGKPACGSPLVLVLREAAFPVICVFTFWCWGSEGREGAGLGQCVAFIHVTATHVPLIHPPRRPSLPRPTCVLIHPSICPSILVLIHHPSIHYLFILLSIHSVTYPFITHESIYPSFCPSIHPSIHPFIHVPIHYHPSIYPSSTTHSYISLPTIHLNVHPLSVHLPVHHLSIHPPVYNPRAILGWELKQSVLGTPGFTPAAAWLILSTQSSHSNPSRSDRTRWGEGVQPACSGHHWDLGVSELGRC